MRSGRITLALLLGALVGLALGVIVKGQMEEDETPTLERPVPPPPTNVMDSPIAQAALRYGYALAENDWDSVVRQTQWMRERLAYARTQGEDLTLVREALVQDLSDRNPAGNRLRGGDIADQYVFQPGVRLEVLVVDEGEPDLEPPAAGRAWMRVTYADKDRAMLDASGLPVKHVVVGVNVDAESLVLKAGISGNLTIDKESISRDWG